MGQLHSPEFVTHKGDREFFDTSLINGTNVEDRAQL